jgi:hypothetical protein
MPVNGKKTPENLATEMARDFFNTIGHEETVIDAAVNGRSSASCKASHRTNPGVRHAAFDRVCCCQQAPPLQCLFNNRV